MKNSPQEDRKKWLSILRHTDEAYVSEADPARPAPRKSRAAAWGIAAACVCCLLIAVNLFLFLPLPKPVPQDLAAFKDSPYYPVMEKVSALKTPSHAKIYKNNAEKIGDALSDMFSFSLGCGNAGSMAPGDAGFDENTATGDAENMNGNAGAPGDNGNGGDAPENSYSEITDNQVAGVIEADRIKRSNRYIYYLDDDTLRVFSIAGEDSEEVGSYRIEGMLVPAECEFYLSADCTTVTVMGEGYSGKGGRACVKIVALDVTDPANIRESGSFAITGAYISSRLTGGKLLLISEFVFNAQQADFDKPETFLPSVDLGNGLECLPAEDIVVPDEVHSSRYTVALLLDESTLQMNGVAAFLSYTDDVYVTDEHIYLSHVYATEGEDGDLHSETEIQCLAYSGEGFRTLGSVCVAGYVKDQYSFDERDGILRVVTTTNSYKYFDSSSVSSSMLQGAFGASSASLYCIDIETWQTVAAVENFAPRYEEVQSVRFDGDTAYVCTSIERSDPVFFFDLSDLSNITYKDTGTIGGYSTSLIQFGNGYLLGIGVGSDWGTFKVEIYEETETGVRAVCSYECNANYSTEYKSYYIDRERQIVGLGLVEYGMGGGSTKYVLLSFDGYRLRELVSEPLSGDPALMRSVLIDGYLYLFGSRCFTVVAVDGLSEP